MPVKELEYPFDPKLISRKKRQLKQTLISSGGGRLNKKIAILCGSTADEIKDILELFLLQEGIKPEFYSSEYNKIYEDAVFGNEELDSFHPDVIYIHSCWRNIINAPSTLDSKEDVDAKLEEEYQRLVSVWESLSSKFGCAIIQNNFDRRFYSLLGNKDGTDYRGFNNFVARLNERINEYAESHHNFYVHDFNGLQAYYGIENFSDPSFWYLYKYAISVPYIPYFSYNLSRIIKSLYGKNKKAFVLDMDNTLWGGVIGDDGQSGIQIGEETAEAEAYLEFQKYLKAHKDLGILLNVNSKNDYENAILGLKHPESALSEDDFIVIKANWNPKSENIKDIAFTLNIGRDSLVFVDDNPAEREIVNIETPEVATPNIGEVTDYIKVLDRASFFEPTIISKDDSKRNEQYKTNAQRSKFEGTFKNYDDYLKGLNMVAEIDRFQEVYIPRIAQLTNKSNQFNLTTKRYTEADITAFNNDPENVCLYGKVADKFGDNGVVSVVICKKEEKDIYGVDLWLMSCRVLKRGVENAMMDEVIASLKGKGVKILHGYYFKTAKNNMVKDFFTQFGFEKIDEKDNGDSVWELDIEGYKPSNRFIEVKRHD